jgi:hypothetical protein
MSSYGCNKLAYQRGFHEKDTCGHKAILDRILSMYTKFPLFFLRPGREGVLTHGSDERNNLLPPLVKS